MRRSLIALVVPVALLGTTVGARADLWSPIGPSHAAASAAPHVRTANESADRAAEFEPTFYPAEIPFTDLAAGDWMSGGLGLALPPTAAGSLDLATHREVRTLRAGPSSAALCLAGMLSAGAWGVVRSVKVSHLGDLPEWYHSGAPHQIGHAVPFDLFGDLPLCWHEQQLGQRPFLYRVRRDIEPRRDAQCFLIIAAPRGPPAIS